MQVEVHHIEAEVGCAALAEHGVEVCSVVVHEASALVNQLCYFGNVVLKNAKRVGVGHHHAGNGVVEQRFEVVTVNSTVGAALDYHHLEAADGGTRGIGAMGRVGDDDACALVVATAHVIGSDGHEACQLTVGTGKRIESELLHASDFGKRLLQVVVNLKRALHCAHVLQRVKMREVAVHGDFLVEFRIIFHCA